MGISGMGSLSSKRGRIRSMREHGRGILVEVRMMGVER